LRNVPAWVWASVLLCALASLWSVSLRHRAETSNRAVGLMMEMSDVEAIALASGVSRSTALADLREHGLVGVAITEDTLGDLVAKGYLDWVVADGGNALVATSRPTTNGEIEPDDEFPWIAADETALLRAARALKRRGLLRTGSIVDGRPLRTVSLVDGATTDLRTIGVGIDPDAARDAEDNGLVIVARLFNEFGADPATITAALDDASRRGATAYLIGGDQALGNRDMLDITETTLRAKGMNYLSPEFVSLGGDGFLRSKMRDMTLRLHSISQVESETMSQSDVVERFAKAYRERGVRWLLLRPTSRASKDLLKRTGQTLTAISNAVRRAGGEIKPPRPFSDPGVPSWLAGVVALLALPAVAWTLLESFGRNTVGWVFTVIAGLAALGAFVGKHDYAALLIATAFPVLGYLGVRASRPAPFFGFLLFSALSLVGGLCVAGMLVGIEYMLRIDQFSGVKLALFAPILVVGWIMLREQGPVAETLKRPVTWAAAVLAIGAMVAVAMLALRSGNEAPTAVSSLELQIRAALDNFLFVRPRSKEVAFGHPALVLGLCLLAYRPNLRGWASLLLLAGMVGQTSIVNTLCHAHTPVLLSLARIGVGLALGGIIGLFFWLVVRRWMPAQETADSHG
jgi:hypothetical protein